MKLLVGLGNPGAKYARNRHNIGFMAMDQIVSDHGFSSWQSKFQGVLSEGRFGSSKVLLLKPETFMNKSRLGIGHPGHKDAVPGYVLRDFPKADEGWLDDLMRGIGDGIEHLVNGHGDKFMNAIALRVAPPRSSKSGPKPKEKAPPEPEASDDRSALQKLVDRFR